MSLTEKLKRDLNNNETNDVQKITKVFNKLRQRINEYEKRLKNNILEVRKNNEQSLQNHNLLVEKKEREFAKTLEKYAKLVSNKDYIQLLQQHSPMINFLDKFKRDLKEVNVPRTKCHRIEGIDDLEAKIDGLLKQTRIVQFESSKYF